MEMTVDFLLRLPFQGLKYDEKKNIILLGKPRPWLNWCTLYPDGRRLIFDKASYDHISWLTGSAQRQKLFCWPCLLFDTATIGDWNSYGVSNSTFLLENIRIHEKTSSHMQSCLDLHTFTMQLENSTNASVLKLELQDRAKVISRNRDTLKYVIDLVCHCASKKQMPDSRNYSCQLEIEDCLKILQFIRSVCITNEVDSAIKLIKDCPRLINDVVDSITGVMKNSIKKETQMSTYVSLIINEHSNTLDKSSTSTVLHYLKNGQVCERFVGFYNLERCKLVNLVYEHVANVISEFNISERFLAYSFDGGILQTSLLFDFVKVVMKTNHPFAFFVPWHAHELQKVLHQSLSHVKKYNLFFKTLTAIQNFFQRHSKRWKAFEELVGVLHFAGSCAPSASNTWFIRTEVTQVVCSYRKYFLEFFDSILQNCERWDTEDIAQVSGFHQYLEEFQTVFLIHVFSKVFKLISNFSLNWESKTHEQIFSWISEESPLEDLKSNLRREKLFGKIWANAHRDYQKTNPRSPNVKKEKPLMISKFLEYRKQVRQIIELITLEIDIRFDGIRSLDFCNLLCRNYIGTHVTDYYIEKLFRAHGQYFDEEDVLTELRILKANASVVPTESVEALFNFFFKANLRHTFSSLYQLAELAMTLPINRSPNNGCDAKMKTIMKWAFTPDESALSGDVSVLCVEWDYLKELKESTSFYNEIIENFFKVNKTLELF